MKDTLKKEFIQLVPSLNDIGGEYTELPNGWEMYLIPMNDLIVKHRLTEWLDTKTSITPKSRYGSNYEENGEQMIVRLTVNGLELYFGSNANNKMRPALWEDASGRIRHAYTGDVFLQQKDEVAVQIMNSLTEMSARTKEDGSPFHTWLADIASKTAICKGVSPDNPRNTLREVASVTPLGCYALEGHDKFYYMAASNGSLLARRTNDPDGQYLTILIDAEWYTNNGDVITDLLELKSFDAFAKVLVAINDHNLDHINLMNLTARAKLGEVLWWKNIYAERGYDVPDVEALAS